MKLNVGGIDRILRIVVGLALVAWELPLALVLAHNTGSALLLALLWGLTVPRRA